MAVKQLKKRQDILKKHSLSEDLSVCLLVCWFVFGFESIMLKLKINRKYNIVLS